MMNLQQYNIMMNMITAIIMIINFDHWMIGMISDFFLFNI